MSAACVPGRLRTPSELAHNENVLKNRTTRWKNDDIERVRKVIEATSA